jgi:hypothetical protein
LLLEAIGVTTRAIGVAIGAIGTIGTTRAIGVAIGAIGTIGTTRAAIGTIAIKGISSLLFSLISFSALSRSI